MKKNVISLLLLASIVNADFIRDDSKEVVLDTTTNLMWQDNNESKTLRKTWPDALIYCEGLELGGYSDWHLPNSNELFGLADKSKYNPAISPKFKYIVSGSYWSSTPNNNSGYGLNSWLVSFNFGYSYFADKTNSLYVRCVRDS